MSVGYKYGMPLNTAARKHLESRGYLIIPPGDTSPLGELVRAAVRMVDEGDYTHLANGMTAIEGGDWVHMRETGYDPAVRAWAEKKT